MRSPETSRRMHALWLVVLVAALCVALFGVWWFEYGSAPVKPSIVDDTVVEQQPASIPKEVVQPSVRPGSTSSATSTSMITTSTKTDLVDKATTTATSSAWVDPIIPASFLRGGYLRVRLEVPVPLFKVEDAQGHVTGVGTYDFCTSDDPLAALRVQCVEGESYCEEPTLEDAAALCAGAYEVREEVPNSGIDTSRSVPSIHFAPYLRASPYRVTFEANGVLFQTLSLQDMNGDVAISSISFPMGNESRASFAVVVSESQVDVWQVELDLFGDGKNVHTLSHGGVDVQTQCTVARALLLRSPLSDDERTTMLQVLDDVFVYTATHDESLMRRIDAALAEVAGDAKPFANVVRQILHAAA